MADPEILRYLAAKTGLGLKYLSKEERISILLEQISDLFPEAILKGGTALNRIYLAKLKVNRFSEDVDLDFASDAGLNEKISAIKQRVGKISGFDVEGPRILHRTLRFDCRYANEFGEKDVVWLEFYLTKTQFLSAEKALVKSPFMETHPSLVRTYSLEDLIARKLIALYDRTEGKDIYDIFYSLDLDFDKSKLLKALSVMLEFYKIDSGNFIGGMVPKLREAKKNSAYIGNSTSHFIPRNLRPDWKIFIDTLIMKLEGVL